MKKLVPVPPRMGIWTISFDAMPQPPNFRQWRLTFKKKVASATLDPYRTFAWMQEIEAATKWQDLTVTPAYHRLDSMIGAGLSTIFKGEFARSILVLEERAQNKGQYAPRSPAHMANVRILQNT